MPVAPGAPEGRLFGVRLRRLRGALVVRLGRRRAGQELAAGAQAAALPGEGEAGDLPVHARGAVARRHVRLQAEARGRYRQALAGRPARRREAAGLAVEVQQHGQSGQWISELFPEVAKHADELCVIRSMHTDLPPTRKRT